MKLVALVLLVGCEKSAPVENAPVATPIADAVIAVDATPLEVGTKVVTVGSGSARRRISTIVDDESSLKPEVVLAKINASYMTGLKRCYKKLLVVSPTAGGKLTLSFTVDEKGRTTSPSVSGIEKQLDDCIARTMKTWTFPVPKDTDGDPTTAMFNIALTLVPE